ncbi:hypothetical protein B0T26DRAFT_298174 [Lasiosphaeria miniovina]|uniref:Uncharacterized protein n=1 Tax=Lasiosphaeria miniovina TaxID=1954250 RepID=A0AA40DYB9_9PEZI|nr:uncharacterized protein B0T26DRAFT_298174 [Lasiosphaeria miniovina]KAK0717501.1 hypothetical protein B0T26DRAFT_298174 [Lasiosphaeria miniovina]
MPLHYTALDSSKSQIRLLAVHPSEDHEYLDQTLSWIQTYVQGQKGPPSPLWLKLDSRVETSPICQGLRNRAVLKARIGYRNVVTNPYWTRIWKFLEFWPPSRDPECCLN